MAVFEARDISKTFGPVQALNGVSIAIARGEGHAIIGENGAEPNDTYVKQLQEDAQAAVDALTEADVPRAGSGDVEPVGVGELTVVAVGRAGHQDHAPSGRDGHPVQGHLLRGGARGELQRGDQAQRLLDGGGDQARVALQERAGFSANSLKRVPVSPAVDSTPPR